MESKAPKDGDVLRIGGVEIPAGERVNLELPVAQLYTHGEVTMPVRVIRGARPGPRLFLCAAIHGDEINGVEIIRRVLRLTVLRRLRGTLIVVPVVNVFGFIANSRYLPDRRDLNRTFPGSELGSLGARLADLFMREIVSNSTHGIDLHTGPLHRSNLPQLRVSLDRPKVRELARAFGAPVIVDSQERDGSLRAAMAEAHVPVLVYEGGEALRFNEVAIQTGLRGVVGVMHALEMLPGPASRKPRAKPLVARASTWVRAPQGGISRVRSRLGDSVKKGEVLGVIGDPFGGNEVEMRAPVSGTVIGQLRLPLVNEGDAVLHIAHSGQRETEVLEGAEALYTLPPPADPIESGN